MPFHAVGCKSKGCRMLRTEQAQSWVADSSPAGLGELGSMRTPCHKGHVLILSCHPVDVPSVLITILSVCNLGLICVSPLFLWQLFPNTATEPQEAFFLPKWHGRETFSPCSSLPSILDPDTGFETNAARAALGLLAGLVVSFFSTKSLERHFT